ncbi:MAG: sulfotransferase domain-containing protein [Acidobacteriota bacterium]
MEQELGTLPDFLIIGAQKSGTSSLYAYLIQHPGVRPATKKEVHYFDARYSYRSVDWYRSFFPVSNPDLSPAGSGATHQLAGEATPYYMFHPCVPRRVAATLPDVKLLAILRNPVDRAYSHYHMAVRARRETLSFEDAIEAEAERLDGEVERLLADDRYRSRVHCFNSYLARGLYVDQLVRWATFFARERMLILTAADLRAAPAGTVRKALDFLELPHSEFDFAESYNTRQYPHLNPATRDRLSKYFEPHNRRLYDFLGVDFGWR